MVHLATAGILERAFVSGVFGWVFVSGVFGRVFVRLLRRPDADCGM